MNKASFFPIELQSFDSSNLTGSYQIVGAVFSKPITLVRVVNASDVAITLSFDGVTDHDIVLASGTEGNTLEINVGPNSGPSIAGSIRKGAGVYVTGSSGTGLLYVAAYGPNQ